MFITGFLDPLHGARACGPRCAPDRHPRVGKVTIVSHISTMLSVYEIKKLTSKVGGRLKRDWYRRCAQRLRIYPFLSDHDRGHLSCSRARRAWTGVRAGASATHAGTARPPLDERPPTRSHTHHMKCSLRAHKVRVPAPMLSVRDALVLIPQRQARQGGDSGPSVL